MDSGLGLSLCSQQYPQEQPGHSARSEISQMPTIEEKEGVPKPPQPTGSASSPTVPHRVLSACINLPYSFLPVECDEHSLGVP